MADSLSSLPTDNTIPHHNELKVVNELFKKHGNSFDSIVGEFKVPIIYGIIFFILSLPVSTNCINYIVPSIEKDDTNVFTILIKTLLFILLVYIIINYDKL